MDNIELLQRLVSAVEESGANIAPTYQEYMPMAFAIANSCGEQGRTCFHRLCRISDKYNRTEADKLYDRALKDGRGQNSLGTVWHLAELAGVKMEANLAILQSCNSPHTHPRAHTREKELEAPKTEKTVQTPVHSGLPNCFPDYDWPAFIRQMVDCGESPAQRDVLLLGGLTVIGSTVNKLLYTPYGKKMKYPCLQTFIIAPPASGKGVISWSRKLAEPLHNTCMANYRKAMEAYQQEHSQWECLGKDKANQAEPQKPPLKLFIIPGNNSGTGVVENLIDADGIGLICEPEADTVSTAIGADYGHWSDTLRNCFDHERLAFNRRTNHEYRECRSSFLSVLLSGTPAQVKPLIPSAENGLFSRQVFYYMPPIEEWVDQFDTSGQDYDREFMTWGQQWERLLATLRTVVCSIRFELTSDQKQAFNSRLSQLFSHAGATHGDVMKSSVTRIAVNLCRMMSVVALLRALDPMLQAAGSGSAADSKTDGKRRLRNFMRRLLACPGLAAEEGTPKENVADGVVSRLVLSIGEADFEAVLGLAAPLYRHACYILSFLPAVEVPSVQLQRPEMIFDLLPMCFSRQDVLEQAVRFGIPENTMDSLLKRFTDKGLLAKSGRGEYEFASHVRARGCV